jgi:hypothetical protein
MDRDQKTARRVIGEECEGGILREFPSQWLDSSISAINQAAKQGDRSAMKAKKLLNDRRFKK